MAVIFYDGFDKYGPSGETNPSVPALITQYWNAVGDNGVEITDPLTVDGKYAIFFGSTAGHWISKTLPGTFSRLIGGFRFITDGVGNHTTYLFKFLDVGTVQCNVIVNIDGTISVCNGDYGGTALGTSAISITQGSKHTIAFDIAFGSSAAYEIKLDGVTILSGSGNTKTTANSYATVFLLGNTTGFTGAAPVTCDDFYLFDTTGSTNNAILSTNPVIRTDFPISDSQTQFTNDGNILGFAYSATTQARQLSGDILYLRKYRANIDCTLNSLSWVANDTLSAAKIKPVVYSDSAGVPNTLLTTGPEIVGITEDITATAALTTPQNLTAAADYWVGFIIDTAAFWHQTVDGSVGNDGFIASNTYTSGAPGTAPVMTANESSVQLWGNCTGASANYQSVSVNPAAGDISSIDSSTPGDEDLYVFPNLPSSITTIYAMSVKGHVRKSDTGARTIDLRVKSGTTDDGGSNTGQTPGNTYQWLESYWEEDPDTSSAWTPSGVNASTAGIKIAS